MLYKKYGCYGTAIEFLKKAEIGDSEEQVKEIQSIIAPYVGSYYGTLTTYKDVYAWFFVNEDGETAFEYASSYKEGTPITYVYEIVEYKLQDGSGETGFATALVTETLDELKENDGVEYNKLDYWFTTKGNSLLMVNCGDYTTFNGSYVKKSNTPPASN